MTTKTKVVVTALLAIVLCISLIAGATFALFTSESSVNVAVSSGKVDVVATLDSHVTLYSPASIGLDGVVIDDNDASTENAFANGGGVVVSGDQITISNITPGDKATLTINVQNNSTVAVKYRTILICDDADGLFAGLNVKIDDVVYNGNSRVSNYATLAAGADIHSVVVEIELPADAANTYQGKELNISYSVEAVQGNADVSAQDNATHVFNMADLRTALTCRYQGQDLGVISIEQDIDMTGWTAVGLNYCSFVLLGNDHSLKNQTAPLANSFGIGTYKISNVKFADANIHTTGEDYAGALVGEIQCNGGMDLTIANCEVIDSTIQAYKYAGGLIGFSSESNGTSVSSIAITNCHVKNTHVSTDDSSVGGLIGHVYSDATITNCSIDAYSSVSCADNRNGGAAKAGALVGTVNARTTRINNCSSAATVNNDNAQQPVANGLVGRVYGNVILDGAIPAASVEDISSAMAMGAAADLGGQTLSEVHISDIVDDISIKNGELEFGYTCTSSYGTFRFDTYLDIRPTEDKQATFENVKFENTAYNPNNVNVTNRTEKVLQFYAGTSVNQKIVFKNCTFKDAYVLINCGSGHSPVVDVEFINCTFDNFGTYGAIWICGTGATNVTFTDCEFNFTATSTQEIVERSGSVTTVITFKGANTLNGTAATAVAGSVMVSQNIAVTVCSKNNSGEYLATINGLDKLAVSGIAVK